MFADPSRPLVVDLGAGPGRFLLLLHQRHTRDLQQQQQQQQQQEQQQQQVTRDP
jgi:tRNA1(Val) A37 N6-methylase TrmN6